MSNTCRVSGCISPITRYGAFCNRHKSASRRHGHPAQSPVTVAQLRPHLRAIRARVERNAKSPLWPAADARWLAIIELAQGVLDQRAAGRAGSTFEARAASEVTKLAASVEPRAVVETVLAMYSLYEHDGRLFKSEDAFRAQVVRRVRGLAEVNVSKWTNGSGQTKRAYSELPPRATEIIAHWLVTAFGAAGLHIARLERKLAESTEQERQEFGKLLSEIE
jgi:hypothetical protein